MVEQEQYKNMLKKVIHETESFKIQSSEELIKKLIDELSKINPITNQNNSVNSTIAE